MPEFDVTPEKRATQLAFMKRQLFNTPPPVTDVSLNGKTVVVTGGSTGLGFEAAKQLIGIGASRVIITMRDEKKGQTAKDEILKSKKSSESANAQTVEAWSLDLASYESVLAFVERLKTLDRLDIFINNAGLSKYHFELNAVTKHEETVQVNYLSHVLLNILVLQILNTNPDKPGRLVSVNSEVASWAKFKERNAESILGALDNKSYFNNQERYFTSKLLPQLFHVELAKRIPATVAVINLPNPGLCISSLQREANGTVPGFIFGIIKKMIGRSAEIGARTLVDAAVHHGPESHGQYLEDCKIQPLAPIVYKGDNKVIDKLWNETIAELEEFNVAAIIDELGGKTSQEPQTAL
ncbi:retinol dehydrogenase 12 [Nemania serpens]|nr:retinol dehydrogenase 12 [Nemania serpens]